MNQTGHHNFVRKSNIGANELIFSWRPAGSKTPQESFDSLSEIQIEEKLEQVRQETELWMKQKLSWKKGLFDA